MSDTGADPGGVRWVRTNPPSSLQYQLFLRAELILGCKHSKNSGELNRRWLADARVDATGAVSVIIDNIDYVTGIGNCIKPEGTMRVVFSTSYLLPVNVRPYIQM